MLLLQSISKEIMTLRGQLQRAEASDIGHIEQHAVHKKHLAATTSQVASIRTEDEMARSTAERAGLQNAHRNLAAEIEALRRQIVREQSENSLLQERCAQIEQLLE